jgi:prepilin-type N-terminal cleavage/methylation domain-containing protein
MTLQPRTRSVARRSAFTLLEVLVVVAIILVLASVATVATMSYLEDAKIDKTKMNLKQAEKAAKTAVTRNEELLNEGDLTTAAVRYIEGGAVNMVDGWGGPITVSMEIDPQTGQQRPRARASTPQGEMTSWEK